MAVSQGVFYLDMKTIAVTLVHDKKDNEQQIVDLLDKLEPQYIEAYMDGEDNPPVQVFNGYKFKDLEEDHEVKVYQFVPQGVEEPANMYDLVSYNILFGNDVPDKDTHWYNVALRRAGQHGADTLAFVDKVEDVIPSDLVVATDVVQKAGKTKIADIKTAEQLDIATDLAVAFDTAVADVSIAEGP